MFAARIAAVLLMQMTFCTIAGLLPCSQHAQQLCPIAESAMHSLKFPVSLTVQLA